MRYVFETVDRIIAEIKVQLKKQNVRKVDKRFVEWARELDVGDLGFEDFSLGNKLLKLIVEGVDLSFCMEKAD